MKHLTLCLLLLISLPLAAADLLRIYFIDVEGGASTLVLTPAGETVLMDTGYAGHGDRDARRIHRVLTREARAARIDYLITSHYHGDHAGGLPALAKMTPVGRFLDYGDPPEASGGKPSKTWEAYLAAVGDRRQIVTPGYMLPVGGGKLTIVAAAGQFIEEPLGEGRANPLCADFERHKQDRGENSRSIGYVLQVASFDFLNLGDLSWNLQHELACPRNLLPEVDLFQVTHHGVRDDVLPQQMWAVKPTVAVMNNGPRKGAGPVAVETVMRSPGLADLWQLHRAVENDDAHNTGEERTANLGETDGCEGHWIRATLHDDGTFTVYNSRNGYEETYQVK